MDEAQVVHVLESAQDIRHDQQDLVEGHPLVGQFGLVVQQVVVVAVLVDEDEEEVSFVTWELHLRHR